LNPGNFGWGWVNMTRSLPILSLLLIVASNVAHAQGSSGTQEQQRACRPDVLRFCRDLHDDYAIANCLRANVEKLRPPCRKVINGGQ
jgi:hypothetical protein